MGHGKAILSTAYFPPVQYISKFILFPDLQIEQFENYNKQSFRNRCIILAANGPLCLSIPVKKDIHPRIPISQLRLDYDTPWTKLHWKAIEAGYRRSPFFEYYEDDFRKFFKEKYEYLLPFNSAILEIILNRIGIKRDLVFTESFEKGIPEVPDFRESIHPKSYKVKEDIYFRPISYNQVFSNKFGFVPNLSVIDLLFNEGPNSLSILMNSVVKI